MPKVIITIEEYPPTAGGVVSESFCLDALEVEALRTEPEVLFDQIKIRVQRVSTIAQQRELSSLQASRLQEELRRAQGRG